MADSRGQMTGIKPVPSKNWSKNGAAEEDFWKCLISFERRIKLSNWWIIFWRWPKPSKPSPKGWVGAIFMELSFQTDWDGFYDWTISFWQVRLVNASIFLKMPFNDVNEPFAGCQRKAMSVVSHKWDKLIKQKDTWFDVGLIEIMLWCSGHSALSFR